MLCDLILFLFFVWVGHINFLRAIDSLGYYIGDLIVDIPVTKDAFSLST